MTFALYTLFLTLLLQAGLDYVHAAVVAAMMVSLIPSIS